jgi:hypothetical protein
MWKKQKGYVGNAKKTKGCPTRFRVLLINGETSTYNMCTLAYPLAYNII